MIALRHRQGTAVEECARLQHELSERQEARDARAAAIRQAEAGRARRASERTVRQEHAGLAVNVGTAEFAAITDRVSAAEAKVSALLSYMEDACREAGFSSKPSGHLRLIDGGDPASDGPRHARLRGHLRLIEGGQR